MIAAATRLAARKRIQVRAARERRSQTMKLTLKHALAAILLVFSFAAPVAAGPLEDADAAYSRGDYATALRIIRPLAEQDNASAQFRLGVMYGSGDGVPKSDVEQLKWFRRAAYQGDADAQYSLGSMYN